MQYWIKPSTVHSRDERMDTGTDPRSSRRSSSSLASKKPGYYLLCFFPLGNTVFWPPLAANTEELKARTTAHLFKRLYPKRYRKCGMNYQSIGWTSFDCLKVGLGRNKTLPPCILYFKLVITQRAVVFRPVTIDF